MNVIAPRRIVIVGGGTSGWLTAAYISRTVGKIYPLEITLIEASDIGVIGVGEATVPTLVKTLKDIDIAEDEFLRAVNGGFKQAIRFQNWVHDPAQQSTHFYHPFHKMPVTDIQAAAHFLYYFPDAAPEIYARYATPQALACDANRSPRHRGGRAGYLDGGLGYAYHMDAVLFGQFLRGKLEGGEVRRVEGKVVTVDFHENGNLQAVRLADGQSIEGDLFIDCSGFRGLLINQFLKVPFKSFADWLPCDKAIAVSVPYREHETVKSYTVATAQKAGWIWDINLASRRGVGHVYSSAHMDAAEAERALLDHVDDPENRQGLELRPISMRVGRNQCLWEKNCVAIGLSGGFIEPLESTGIFLVEKGIRHLLDNWPVGGDVSSRRYRYNKLMHDQYDEILFFVLMHYVTSRRRDSLFWREITRDRELPVGLGEMLALWRERLPSMTDVAFMTTSIFGYESYIAILAGMGFFRGMPSLVAKDDKDALLAYLRKQQAAYRQQVAALPGHMEYLQAIHHGYGVVRPAGLK